MTPENLKNNLGILERALKREQGIRYILAVSLVVMTIAFLNKSMEAKTILEPFGCNMAEVSISDNGASKEYLKLITEKSSRLGFTYTPDTAEENFSKLLKIVSPSDYGSFQKIVLKQIKKIKKNNLSSVFFPSQYQYDLLNSRVVVTGILKRFSGEKNVFSGKKSFLYSYDIISQKLTLSSYSDVTGIKNPLLVKFKEK